MGFRECVVETSGAGGCGCVPPSARLPACLLGRPALPRPAKAEGRPRRNSAKSAEADEVRCARRFCLARVWLRSAQASICGPVASPPASLTRILRRLPTPGLYISSLTSPHTHYGIFKDTRQARCCEYISTLGTSSQGRISR